MGLLTEQDVQQLVRYVFHEVFDRFLDERSIRICVAAKDWNVFSTAVREWKKDGKEYHLQACSWLQFSRDNEAKGFKCGDEAAVADKVLLLEMLEAFHVPIEYYRPVPDGIICPDIHPAHFPGEYWIGEEIWEQDGGLCQGNIVPEEQVTLIDHYSLKTILQIHQHTIKSEKNRYHDFDYAGTGTIEGYTSARPRDMKIYLNKHINQIAGLKLFMDNDDYEVYYSYPLWEKYREFSAEVNKIQDRIIKDLIADHLQL